MIQKIGTEATFKSGPRNMELDGGGSGTLQKIGTSAALGMKPVGNGDFINRSGGGTIQSPATAANLNKTPQHGWSTPSVPMSERAIKQSK